MNGQRYLKMPTLVGSLLMAAALAGPAWDAEGRSTMRIGGDGEVVLLEGTAPRSAPRQQLAAGAVTSCACGAFSCKGIEFPACTMQCAEPDTAICDCGYCERTLGSPSSSALGPVANDCACR